MASSALELTLISYLPAYIDALDPAASDAAANLARLIGALASPGAPRKTGALSVSDYVVEASGASTYDAAVAAALSANARATLAPAAQVPPPGQAVLAYAVAYAQPVHDGRALASGGTTVAQPWLQRALTEAQGRVEEAGFFAALTRRAKERGAP
jgi:hypothetical protein